MSGASPYFEFISHGADEQKIVLAGALAATMVVVGAMATSKVRAKLASPTVGALDSFVVPPKRLSLFGIFDFVVETFVNYHDSILGKAGRVHVPFTLAVFLFIVAGNLAGLIPGFPAITTSVWINVGVALVVFGYFNISGIISHGFWSYLKHFCGPMLLLVPLMLPIELVSVAMRVLTLNLRLYWNITADHSVLEAMTSLSSYGLPVIFYAFGTFVCLMQAFVFTTMTMVYIQIASEHSEEEGHGHAGHSGHSH